MNRSRLQLVSTFGAIVLLAWLVTTGAAPAAELVAAKGTDVTSFDPGINPTPDAQQVITMIYDTLIQRDDNMTHSTSPDATPAGSTANWVRRDDAAILGWRHLPRVVFERGQGLRLWDVDGREYLDFVSGHISLLLGHNHPELREVLIEQSAKLWHHYKYFAATPVIEFAETLKAALPEGLDVINFAAVGSEANEIALRVARGVTKAFDVVAVIGGLYGGTLTVEGLNSIGGPRKRHLGPLLNPARTSTILTPDCYRCPIGLKYPSCDIECVKASEELTDRVSTGDVAAIITESILGAGGMWLPDVQRGAYEVASDAQCGYIVEPDLALFKFQSRDMSPSNNGRYIDRMLDELYAKQSRATDPAVRKRYIREFERRLFDEEAHYIPTLQWHRIIVHTSRMKGWTITPSHYLNNQLDTVWLSE